MSSTFGTLYMSANFRTGIEENAALCQSLEDKGQEASIYRFAGAIRFGTTLRKAVAGLVSIPPGIEHLDRAN